MVGWTPLGKGMVCQFGLPEKETPRQHYTCRRFIGGTGCEGEKGETWEGMGRLNHNAGLTPYEGDREGRRAGRKGLRLPTQSEEGLDQPIGSPQARVTLQRHLDIAWVDHSSIPTCSVTVSSQREAQLWLRSGGESRGQQLEPWSPKQRPKWYILMVPQWGTGSVTSNYLSLKPWLTFSEYVPSLKIKCKTIHRAPYLFRLKHSCNSKIKYLLLKCLSDVGSVSKIIQKT